MAEKLLAMDAFAIRQFSDPTYAGTRFADISPSDFLAKALEKMGPNPDLKDGYAPFCKHIFIENFTDAEDPVLEITDENREHLRSGYTKRRPEELAVLSRWFDGTRVEKKRAAYLDLILYSREQCIDEKKALPSDSPEAEEVGPEPWRIISIKGQSVSHETPMQPITALRNALGQAEGGSGVPVDRVKYAQAVAFWERHAPVL
eukprot:TRINITY_DN156_c0_g1_i1.p2 TRINITY_DN156_c0_g1~~TRINITY_DN156_c0_g1_i1.p2  ORF type:complete len:203 (-),score=79.63 TRINITY_DN156_c0_g1_i1:50-658(-)